MMSPEDVAEVVMFVLTLRLRGHRVLEVALRPVSEESWGSLGRPSTAPHQPARPGGSARVGGGGRGCGREPGPCPG